jgi:hypothetical protein
MTLPRAVCVGPMKTSTTWLYRQLRQHPDVWLCPIKELQLLDYLDESIDHPSREQVHGYHRKLHDLNLVVRHILKKDEVTRADLEAVRVHTQAFVTERFDFDWYASFFADVPDGKSAIEVAPTYSYADPGAVKRFADVLGRNTPILFILRNPVDRWLSLGRFDLKVGQGEDVTDENIPVMAEFMAGKWKKLGGYREYIETWEAAFENVHFVSQDDLHATDGRGLEQVCSAFGLAWLPDVFTGRDARVNSQGEAVFPDGLRAWVGSERMAELEWLADRFGGAAETWRDDARKLLG